MFVKVYGENNLCHITAATEIYFLQQAESFLGPLVWAYDFGRSLSIRKTGKKKAGRFEECRIFC
jgi:hypothetical protein